MANFILGFGENQGINEGFKQTLELIWRKI